jgi:hypothetical protein
MAGRKPNAPQYRIIYIIAVQGTGEIIVHEPWTCLNKSNNEEAEWRIIPSGREFTVRFNKGDGTPFKGDTFTGNDTVVSGPIDVAPRNPPVGYRYSVDVPGVGKIDPGIFVWDRH